MYGAVSIKVGHSGKNPGLFVRIAVMSVHRQQPTDLHTRKQARHIEDLMAY